MRGQRRVSPCVEGWPAGQAGMAATPGQSTQQFPASVNTQQEVPYVRYPQEV